MLPAGAVPYGLVDQFAGSRKGDLTMYIGGGVLAAIVVVIALILIF